MVEDYIDRHICRYSNNKTLCMDPRLLEEYWWDIKEHLFADTNAFEIFPKLFSIINNDLMEDSLSKCLQFANPFLMSWLIP